MSIRPLRSRSGPAIPILIAAFLAIVIPVCEAAAAPARASGGADPGLASPADTLRTFLDALGGDDVDRVRAVECLDTSGVPVEARAAAATRLYRILNRIEWIDLEHDRSIPTSAALRAMDDPIATWRLFPRDRDITGDADGVQTFRNGDRAADIRAKFPDLRIDLVVDARGRWRFAPGIVGEVEEIAPAILAEFGSLVPDVDEKQLETFAERIEGLFPESWRDSTVLGVAGWKWAAIALLVVLAMTLDMVIRVVLALLTRRAIRRRGGEVDGASIRRAVRPFGMAVAAIVMLRALPMLALPSSALLVLGPALRFYAMLAVVWSVFRLVDVIGEYFAQRAEKTENRFDDLVVPLLRKSAKIIVGVFGLIYIADAFSVEIGPLLTGLGIGGVGFAFAAKDTLENFFGSITVIVDRPFEVGDWVVIGETEGVVEELGLRSVRVRTFYNSLVTIPTANLVRARVDNYGQRKYRRWKTHLNIAYETSPEAVEAFCAGVKELIRSHPYTRKDYYEVWLHQFGPSSIDVLVYMFFEAPDWSTELRERHRLMLDIMRLAGRLGVEFAYPTQRLVMEQGPGPSTEGLPDPATVEVSPTGHDAFARRLGRSVVRNMTADERWRERVPPPQRTGVDEDDAAEGPPDTQVESRAGGDA